MCGIFGIVNKGQGQLAPSELRKITDHLFKLSETRGREASGLTLHPSNNNNSMYVLKSPAPASSLIRSQKYKELFSSAFDKQDLDSRRGIVFGHTRLVTNGSQLDEDNNQPVVRDGTVAVHNGIIVNVDDLWKNNSDLERKSQVDTEILVALTRKYFDETGSVLTAVRKVFAEIKGTASIAMTFSDINALLIATNNGSVYFASAGKDKPLYFASERYIIDQFLESKLGLDFHSYKTVQLYPNQGVLIDLDGQSEEYFLFSDQDPENAINKLSQPREIKALQTGTTQDPPSLQDIVRITVPKHLEEAFDRLDKKVHDLQRCTKCVMPETVPFISFNSDGVCNFCQNYKKIELKGRKALEERLEPFRKPGKDADCLMAVSGGRDSCYGLHYIIKEMGMKPIAYTYDWGLVTDLARRNIARMCSALGVEHIIVSPNISWKRANVRKNVSAWLKKPHLGMIPLFMAGDKQFMYYGAQVRKQNKLGVDIFSFNLLEKTQFKEEFTGIQFWKPGEDADQFGEQLPMLNRMKLAAFYGKEFLMNPGYWNQSLYDTFIGFLAYYFYPQDYVSMFTYLPWVEKDVNALLESYDWELATDTQSTWRIGDGTASFYNYIYYMTAGFTENDTMRSNQVREGHLNREEALALTYRDNRPRWDTFKWYCDIIGLDFEYAAKTINNMDKVSPILA